MDFDTGERTVIAQRTFTVEQAQAADAGASDAVEIGLFTDVSSPYAVIFDAPAGDFSGDDILLTGMIYSDQVNKTIGDIYSLSPGPENIKVAAGTYEFYFNDITGRFSIVKVKAE
jgi:hypothetical protein